MDALANILIIFFSVLIIGAALFITIRQLKRQRERAETFLIPENLPIEGVDVPLMRSFSGISVGLVGRRIKLIHNIEMQKNQDNCSL